MATMRKDSLKSGEMTGIKEGGKSILVANVDGNYYAMADICPHLLGRCNLHKGTLDGTSVQCPCHGTTFDVTSGKLLSWIPDWPEFWGKATRSVGMAKDLDTYKCKIDGEDIKITIVSELLESDKSRFLLLLLSLFLGWIGGHRFYVKKTLTGLLMLFTMGGFGMWYFVDLIMVALGVFKDKNRLPVTKWF